MEDDDIQIADKACPKCEHHTLMRDCGSCDGDGLGEHDCGEDCCVCLDPEPNTTCWECLGHGWHNWCPRCGWDLVQKQYLNGCDERYREKASG